MSEPAIRIQNVSKAFDTIKALKGVSFDVPKQSIFGLLGPNGAGKTTLFSIIAHFLKADTGGVEVLGIDVRKTSELQGRMTILPQDALFQKNVPIIEQLSFFRRLDGSSPEDARAEVTKTLEMVGLSEYMKRGVHALSHGMVKRLGLAQAFLGEPEVILLDEPTSGLDPKNASQIRDLVREFHRKEATVVISSHNLLEIQELCDHVAILDKGNLVVSESVAEITRGHRQLDISFARPISKDEGESIQALRGVKEVARVGPQRYMLDMAVSDDLEPEEIVTTVLRHVLDLGLPPRQFTEGSSLEEAFLKMTGGDDE